VPVPSVFAADTVRIGLPTKTYWPTIVAEAANQQKLFEKEGITAELTVYRGGAEAFEALAAGAADVILDPPALPAAGKSKGVEARVVAGGSNGYFGWQLMVPAKSTLTVADLKGKKVGITSAGSASDLLALWTIQAKKIDFVRVPLGGGGLVPNLLSGNVDAAVVYSPLSFQMEIAGDAKTLIEYSKEVPPHLNSGWIASETLIKANPALIQKTLNALFGGLQYLRNDRAGAIKLIAELDEIPDNIAALEYERTILNLDPGNPVNVDSVALSLDLAKLGGMTGLAPAAEIVDLQFKPVPTKP
jgi:ABC-type nitrate/sulfonate/bicarbonate transport system substrate-binding protein